MLLIMLAGRPTRQFQAEVPGQASLGQPDLDRVARAGWKVESAWKPYCTNPIEGGRWSRREGWDRRELPQRNIVVVGGTERREGRRVRTWWGEWVVMAEKMVVVRQGPRWMLSL